MDVSVITVSYNVAGLLKDCVESILKYTDGIEYEIIIVDNQSTDDSRAVIDDLVKAHPTKIKKILAAENGGFSKGNNLGIRQATGKYLLLLNPDTLLVENTLKKMFDWLEGNKDIAVATGQVLDNDHHNSPIFPGAYFPTLPRVFAWAFFLDDLPGVGRLLRSYHIHADNSHWRELLRLKAPARPTERTVPETKSLDWVNGAFFMVRHEAITGIGLLDENIFLYGEELEWCWRFKKAGWLVGYTPVTKIIHLERKSSGGLPRNAVLGEFRGLKYIYGKRFPGWKQIILGSLLDIAAFLRVVFWLVRLKLPMAQIYAEALFV
jgi:GT2 family glycosyltransferase